MNITEWVKNNKLLSVAIAVVIIYLLILLGTRQAPVDKEVAPTKEKAAEMPAEKTEAPAEKAVAPEAAPVAMENESVKEQIQ